jgi:DNA-binding HxlR family transcriptional regulator
MPIAKLRESTCSVARSLSVLGERWTLLVVREALTGTTRFETFREHLGLTADVLSDRLATLVDSGVMRREAYREPGKRPRDEYVLTDVGRELHVVVAALQQWGDEYLPHPDGPSVSRRTRRSAEPVRVAFIDPEGHAVAEREVVITGQTHSPTGLASV